MAEQIALITGASSGIGKATAKALAQRGLRVFAGVRRAEAGDSLRGAGITPVLLDVRGIGGQLLRYTEARVRESAGRLLLIETSSLPKFDPTRAFCAYHGYREVARIPDFYTDGDSRVIFAKRLAPEPTR